MGGRQRGHTPASGVAHEGSVETMQAIARRQHDTIRTAQTTLDSVGELRTEFGGRIDQLDARVDDLSVASARVEGKLDILVEVSKERRILQVSAVQASIEVEKTGQLAKIGEGQARADFRRTVGLKIIAGIGAAWALLSAMILAGRC